jgi:hypothetical protein
VTSNLEEVFDELTVCAAKGGYDRADVYDTAGNDRYQSWAGYGYLDSLPLYGYLAGFDLLVLHATAGGVDEAVMYDSPGDDSLSGLGSSFDCTRSIDRVLGEGFRVVNADSSQGGFDTLDLNPDLVDYLFTATGNWTHI